MAVDVQCQQPGRGRRPTLRPRALPSVENSVPGRQIHALQHAVFVVNYRSPRQRMLRCAAILLISVKHGVRGMLYVWPLALLLFIPLPGAWQLLRIALIIAAIGAWFRFIYGAVRDDYARHARSRLLKPGDLWKMW